MNRRRMMMAQQSKGFELVYDAASGLLPTECGWKIIKQDETAKMTMINGVCAISSTNGIRFVPVENSVSSICSIEMEFCHTGINQGLSITFNDNITSLSALLGSNAINGVSLHQQWGKNFYKGDPLEQNIYYTTKLKRHGNTFYFYINNELLYSGELSGAYTTTPNGFNVSGRVQTLIKRIVYTAY